MRLPFLLIVFAALINLTGCATTETTGYVDPAYSNGTFHTKKVVVRVDGGTLAETDLAETAFAQNFSDLGVESIRYMDLVPPTRNYSEKKAMKIVKDTGADSLFITYVGGKSSVDSYVPPTYHAGTSNSTVNVIGNTAHVNTYSSPGYTTGGYTVSLPVLTSVSYLMDMTNGNNIWKAEGFSSGIEFTSFTDLVLSAGNSAIADLKAKGLVSAVE